MVAEEEAAEETVEEEAANRALLAVNTFFCVGHDGFCFSSWDTLGLYALCATHVVCNTPVCFKFYTMEWTKVTA